MELYVLRHGIAEDGRPGRPDSERALTDEGRAKVAQVAGAARRAGVAPTAVVCSPYLRAVQTAAAAAKVLEYEGELTRSEVLVPHGTPGACWQELRDFSGEPAVLVVGHEPLLSSLVSFLLG